MINPRWGHPCFNNLNLLQLSTIVSARESKNLMKIKKLSKRNLRILEKGEEPLNSQPVS